MAIFDLQQSKQNRVYESSVKLFNPQPRDKGDLPFLIYLPGMDGSGELFANQMEGLTPYFNLRCLSIASNDLSDWQQLAKATIDCLRSELLVENKKKIYLCGESFGGCLAMLLATIVPRLFAGMVLVNPASSFNQQPILSWGIGLTRAIPEWLHRSSAVGLLPFLAALNRMQNNERQALLAAMKSLPQEVVSWRLSLLKEFTITPSQCSQFRQPTLIIASKSDRLLPSVKEASRLVDLFPNSQQEILIYSGHACLLEKDVSLVNILDKNDFLHD